MSDPQKIPSNLEAEHALLGIALFDNDAVRRVNDRIRPEHFCEPFHQHLWEAVSVAVAADKLADPITMHERFKGQPLFVEKGGLTYLMNLVDRAPPATGAEDYAGEVFNTWSRRSLLDLAQRASKAAYAGMDDSGSTEPFEIIAGVRRDLEAIEHASAPGDELFVDAETAGAIVMDAAEQVLAGGKPKGLKCGLACIDRRLGGLHAPDLIILAGRPSMGKSALARNICYGAADRNPDKLFPFVSAEMSADELSQRALSSLTFHEPEPTPYERFRKATLTPMEMARLHEVRRLLPRNVLILDKGKPSVESIARSVWALRRRGEIGALFIDYLQILRRPQAKGRNETTVIGEMTSDLKALAKDARIPIVLLSQLSRSVESREDKRPMLSDLRESGAIEQDADVVIFPFREGYYLERAEPKEGTGAHMEWEAEVMGLRTVMDVICAKQRHGPIGTDRQTYHADIDLILDRERVQ